MRLDLFLKASRLISRRSLAQEFCDAGLICVNGIVAKSSKDVAAGDEIEIKRRDRTKVVRVRAIPAGKQVEKSRAGELFEVVSDGTNAD